MSLALGLVVTQDVTLMTRIKIAGNGRISMMAIIERRFLLWTVIAYSPAPAFAVGSRVGRGTLHRSMWPAGFL